MPVQTFRPLTPSSRYIAYADFSDITKTKPEKSLVETRKRTGGRNVYGRMTARGIGGGHKQKIRLVDFKRNKHGVEATVKAIEYDPRRTARLALLEYKDGEKTYIIAPGGLQVGAKLMSGPTAPPELGNSLPLRTVPVGLPIHNIEIIPGRGAQMVRTAGGSATLMSRDEGYAQIRLPSGEIRRINENCYATIGQVSNCRARECGAGQSGTVAPPGHPADQPRRFAQPGGPSERRRRRQVEVRRRLAAAHFTVGSAGQRLPDAQQEEAFQPVHPGPARRPADEEQVILTLYGTLN